MNLIKYIFISLNILIIFITSANSQIKIQKKILPKQFYMSHFEKPYLAAFVDTNYIFLTWSVIKGAKGYNLYRRDGSNQFEKINSKIISWVKDETTACNKYNSLLPLAKYNLERNHISKTIISKLYSPSYEWLFPCPPFTNHKAEAEIINLSKIYHQVGIIIGQAYYDNNVTDGTIYSYKVKWLDQNDNETEFGNEVKVQAGVIKKLSKPTGLKAESGDSQILLLWNENPSTDTICGYHVFRSLSQNGPFVRFDSIPVFTKVSVNINGDSLNSPQYGFYDNYVNNYSTYFYKTVPRNMAGKLGPMSNVVSAMPKDLTQPMMPRNFSISVLTKDTMLISWTVVTRDIKNRNEIVKGYWIFKYQDYNTAVEDTGINKKHLLKFVEEPWTKFTVHSLSDTVRSLLDMNLVAEKVYWFRILTEDTSGNFSYKTAAISAILPDVEPPEPVTNLKAEGFDDYIQIAWDKPDEAKKKNKDLAGYMIYRGICGGSKVLLYREKYKYEPYPLHLITDITNKDTLIYKDYNVPRGSPICYRYAIKSYDKSQNLSVMSDSVCERLLDKTPPDPPIITKLQARNKAVKIECSAPPIQDLKGFIVERSENGKSGWKQVYSDSIPKTVSCGSIPFSSDSILAKKINQLSFSDNGVEPEDIYWYRIITFDYNGNKSKPSSAFSTFTYEIKTPAKPVNLKAKLKDNSVTLNWEPDVSKYPKTFAGFIVLRSIDINLGYRQISKLFKKSEYIDDKLAQGVTYWYKIQAIDSNGDFSLLSDPISITNK